MTSLWFDAHPPAAPVTDFVEGAHVDTIVAGAGLTGLTTAVLLARSREPLIAMHPLLVALGRLGAAVGREPQQYRNAAT